MKLTKQQKVLGGVMFAGLIAVGFDRWSAASANAATVPAPLDQVAPLTTTVVATPAAPLSFAQRLAAQATDRSAVRGAFELGSAWQTTEVAAPKPVVDTAADTFAAGHKLNLTMVRGERCGAVVDGKLVVVGQSVGGFKLVAVTEHAASFSNGRSKVTLSENAR